MDNKNISLIEIPVSQIEYLEKNPRTITEDEFEKLVEDIRNDPNYLMQRPPLLNRVDGKMYCYAGTQRSRAATAAGMEKIWCFVEDNVPERVQDERMIKDNLHRGQWDEVKLLAFDIELNVMHDFGFKDFEVSIFDNQTDDEPKDLTAPLTLAPPTMKLTFTDTRQMDYFENLLKGMIEDNQKLETIKYSVSQGEI